MPDVTLIGNTLNTMGGGERVTAHMLLTLEGLGHDVTLKTWDKPDWDRIDRLFHDEFRLSDHVKCAEPLGSDYVPLDRVGWSDALRWLGRSRRIYRKTDLVVNSQGNTVPSYAHVSYVHFPTFALLHPALEEIAKYHLPAYASSRKDEMMMRMRQPVYKSLMEHSTVVLANSHFTKNCLDKVVEAETSVLYPPVDAKDIIGFAETSGERGNVVVTISHIRRDKRLELIPEIAKKVEEAEFRVIGHVHDSDYHRELLQAVEAMGVEDRVRFETGLDRGGLLRSIVKAKVYLHTMPYEHFGISPVEAMAAGLVPVVHRSGGPYQDVLDGKQGEYGYGYEGVQDAAERITELLGDERLRESLSEKCVERSKMFDTGVFREHFALYIDLALNGAR